MQDCPNTLSPYRLILFFALLVAWMSLISYLSGLLSGWHTLFRRFREQSKFRGQYRPTGPFFFNACLKNWANYSGIMRIAVEENAIHLSVTFPFRVGHLPLCIPWNEIQFGATKFLWRKYVVLTIGDQERIPMRISERMARNLGILNRVPDESTSD